MRGRKPERGKRAARAPKPPKTINQCNKSSKWNRNAPKSKSVVRGARGIELLLKQ